MHGITDNKLNHGETAYVVEESKCGIDWNAVSVESSHKEAEHRVLTARIAGSCNYFRIVKHDVSFFWAAQDGLERSEYYVQVFDISHGWSDDKDCNDVCYGGRRYDEALQAYLDNGEADPEIKVRLV